MELFTDFISHTRRKSLPFSSHVISLRKVLCLILPFINRVTQLAACPKSFVINKSFAIMCSSIPAMVLDYRLYIFLSGGKHGKYNVATQPQAKSFNTVSDKIFEIVLYRSFIQLYNVIRHSFLHPWDIGYGDLIVPREKTYVYLIEFVILIICYRHSNRFQIFYQLILSTLYLFRKR